MNSNLLAWIEALESGRYQQTKGVLRRGDCFCALGVGVDVFGVTWEMSVDRYYAVHNNSYMRVFMRGSILNHYGITTRQMYQISDWNDIKGMSFPQIAKEMKKWIV